MVGENDKIRTSPFSSIYISKENVHWNVFITQKLQSTLFRQILEENLDNEDGRERDSAINNENLKAVTEANKRTVLRKLAVELGIGFKTVSSQLKVWLES